MVKYSDVLCAVLKRLDYTHCFFVAGGHNMHLLASVSRHFTCVPVVHEVAAGIAAEYFNECETGRKAFALVTSGPGLTNMVSAIAGAYLESRELLVLGGQVKTADLAHGALRQRGIQELDGVALVSSITKRAVRLTEPMPPETLTQWVMEGSTPRKGPVFLELPLDIQGRQVEDDWLQCALPEPKRVQQPEKAELAKLESLLARKKRPVLLLGAGVNRATAKKFLGVADRLGIPITVTWNAADRIGADHPLYFGRPNTWGQRYSNMILQQADCVLALGTRLGMQQTGFNWRKFVPVGDIVQVDCDAAELNKGHPKTVFSLCADANAVLMALAEMTPGDCHEWVAYCREVKGALPVVEANHTGENFVSPHSVCEALSRLLDAEDTVIPCSSGGAFTVMMQTFAQKAGQTLITNKGLASMGYGLSGAIGAAFAHPGKRTVLVEGDGGFTQNLQELGTVDVNRLNLKIFIFNDNGYASIRMTQKNYFNGNYVGCDTRTGLGIPRWQHLFAAYDIPLMALKAGFENDPDFLGLMQGKGPVAFLVPIDPEQTYLPKITSRVLPDGNMESNPLHRMTPLLPKEMMQHVGKYLPMEE